MDDLISRQETIEAFTGLLPYAIFDGYTEAFTDGLNAAYYAVCELPSAQPEKRTEKRTETHACDLISRQAAIDGLFSEMPGLTFAGVLRVLQNLPSAQPEQRCVNCGRTANNGGWYEDGGTRCPIEEHYALPKDGYCHLWEKIKVWEDDYVERPKEGKK